MIVTLNAVAIDVQTDQLDAAIELRAVSAAVDHEHPRSSRFACLAANARARLEAKGGIVPDLHGFGQIVDPRLLHRDLAAEIQKRLEDP